MSTKRLTSVDASYLVINAREMKDRIALKKWRREKMDEKPKPNPSRFSLSRDAPPQVNSQYLKFKSTNHNDQNSFEIFLNRSLNRCIIYVYTNDEKCAIFASKVVGCRLVLAKCCISRHMCISNDIHNDRSCSSRERGKRNSL